MSISVSVPILRQDQLSTSERDRLRFLVQTNYNRFPADDSILDEFPPDAARLFSFALTLKVQRENLSRGSVSSGVHRVPGRQGRRRSCGRNGESAGTAARNLGIGEAAGRVLTRARCEQ